ncbi:MAG: glycosyltransferase family 4 protein [Planctomycetes bacterium]|nr:glycosyltransferase family 4 protein [Planctomycetota bacterium]
MSLRVAHVTTFYPPRNFGGDGIGIQRLVRALASHGIHNTVIFDADAFAVLSGRAPPSVPAEHNVEVVALSSTAPRLSLLAVQQLGRPVAHAARLRELLAPGRFDIVLFHNVSLIGGPAVWSHGDALKLDFAHEHWLVCPSHVLWRHGRELCTGRECLRCQLHHRRPPQLWRHTSLLERHGRAVDAFVAMSEFSRAKHREFGFPFEMEVLPYFLCEESAAPAPARPQTRPFFLFVGRLERIKGLDDVIPLLREFPEADLLVAGTGGHEGALRELGRDLPNVRFLGRVSEGDLRALYAHCEALVVPSSCFETFGIILIEAFRAGAPVIARRLGPFPELVETSGAGELFASTDELRSALRRSLADPARRAGLAAAGRAAFSAHWSERAVLPRFFDLLARTARRRGRLELAERIDEAARHAPLR